MKDIKSIQEQEALWSTQKWNDIKTSRLMVFTREEL